MRLRKLYCKVLGHSWTTYPYSPGYYSYDIEKAGHCDVCGCDTHNNDNSIMSWKYIIKNKIKERKI